MEFVLAPEVWSVVVVAAGSCGWIFGEMYGATRRVGDRLDMAAQDDSLFTMTVPPKIAQAQNVPCKTAIRRQAAAIRTEPPVQEDTPKSPRQERFANMPPVRELREQASWILKTNNVWAEPDIGERLSEVMRGADPGSLGLLNHYRKSIEELQQANAILDRFGCEPSQALGSDSGLLPRLSDVAPVSPNRSLSELACQKEERGQDVLPRSHDALG